jgi:phosphoglycolate phosphatase
MPRTYDLIVFDWDGTLMDSLARIVNCFRAAAEDTGVSYPGDTAVRDIVGLGLEEAMGVLFPDSDPVTRGQLQEAYREHFLERDQTQMELFPGVRAGLMRLHGQGHRLAIATGKARRGLDRLLLDSPLRELFVATRCADETRSKPHPLMLEEILEETGTSVDRAIMIGDSVLDMEMARNAGMDALAVSYGAHPCARLQAFRPLACASSFDDVVQWMR